MTTTGADGMARTLAREMAATLTAGLVVGAALSACQGQGSATRPPPTFATPTAVTATAGETTDSPTGGATRTDSAEIPAAARANTAAGAEAFARFYFGRLNEAVTRPDPSRLAGLASPACTSCRNFVDLASGLQSDREHISPAPYVASNFTALPESSPSRMGFQLLLVQPKTRTLSAHQQVLDVGPAERHVAEVLVVRTAGTWLIGDIATADKFGERR